MKQVVTNTVLAVKLRSPPVVNARSLSCSQQKELDNMQLSKYLKEADQTKSIAERYRLLKMAVELGEKMELQIGHQGRLYDMAANAAYQCEGLWFKFKN